MHQFLIVLSGTDPLVWRRIQVPESYSFWDLHVADLIKQRLKQAAEICRKKA